MVETWSYVDDDDRQWLVPVGETPRNPAPCRGCQKLILWVMTARGKPSPRNADGTSHFATCPKASDFRRGATPAVTAISQEKNWPKRVGYLTGVLAAMRKSKTLAFTEEQTQLLDTVIELGHQWESET
jgi:hypothetical protein